MPSRNATESAGEWPGSSAVAASFVARAFKSANDCCRREHQFQIGIPIGRLGKIRQSRRRFGEPAAVHVEPDAALGANGGLAGALELYDSAEFVRRQHLDDRETGRNPEHRRNLTGGEPSHGGSGLFAQGGAIDITQQAAIERCRIHGLLASEHGEIGAFLDLCPDASRLLG